MKFLHLSDIHLGKRPFGANLSEDHDALLAQMLALAAREDVDAVLIAGDVYNRAQPGPESITQFSRFLTQLADIQKPVMIVRGNHDGEAQLAYAAGLLKMSGLYFSNVFDGGMDHVILNDAFGEIIVWLLPYIKPAQVRAFYPDEKIESYADGVRTVIRHAKIDPARRNVLLTLPLVAGAVTSESEQRSVGGLDMIPADVFSVFDYVALGHLHKSQTMDNGRIRYCGAPMAYAFDECGQDKSATIVTVGEKGSPNAIETVDLVPPHVFRTLEGTLEELCALPASQDYIQARLTDAVRPLDPVGSLRLNYPNLLNLIMDTQDGGTESISDFEPTVDPLEHFCSFYIAQNGHDPSPAQVEVIAKILEEVETP